MSFAGLCTLFLVFTAIGVSSRPATAGEAYFCGVVSGVGAMGGEPAVLEDYGIVPGQRYAARMDLTDRPPDGIGSHNVWGCDLPGLECGTVEFRFEGFRSPQTSPYPAAVLGVANASMIARSIVTYQMQIDLDEFVVGAVGEIDLSMVCTTCWNTADLLDAAPVHTAPGNNLNGVVNMALRIPGVGSQTGVARLQVLA